MILHCKPASRIYLQEFDKNNRLKFHSSSNCFDNSHSVQLSYQSRRLSDSIYEAEVIYNIHEPILIFEHISHI